eukprot:TRINITY_DN7742_c0_g1_i6.p1 TRINITY_DN7742_c0_g1~~TRINITY_DN7742_c0_g1_i6.p1  ORF type:complete len:318 (+),score=54.40 TRINITY_DN7742_c0_g1_i6:497-1450(+)
MINIKSKKIRLFVSKLLVLILIPLNLTRVNAEDKVKNDIFKLPKLPYVYNALEPYIDEKTMEIHYNKHHGGYVEKLNEAIIKYPQLKDKSIEELLSNLEAIPMEIRETVRNNGGGHYNHSLFWSIMGNKNTNEPKGKLKEDIEKNYGSFEIFKKKFKTQALSRFGSGWTWLIKDEKGNLNIISTPNQDSPIMKGIVPIMGLDVWEHAYYLKYQNKRGEYIDNWWNVVNWDEIENRYATQKILLYWAYERKQQNKVPVQLIKFFILTKQYIKYKIQSGLIQNHIQKIQKWEKKIDKKIRKQRNRIQSFQGLKKRNRII